jgi:hypothetical protein
MPSPKVSPERSQRFCFLRATRRAASPSVLSMGILRRSSWNGDRLDEFSRRTDEGFKKVNQRLDRLTNRLLGGTLGVIAAIVGTGILG